MKFKMLSLMFAAAMLVGCGKVEQKPPQVELSKEAAKGEAKSFSLAWSEYPSWSVFGVASELGLIDGAQGQLGPIEQKYNIDIVLKEADYDTCFQLYNAGTVDAACLTNMDTLAPSLARPAVAICPTSTSVGGDVEITVAGIKTLDQLKGVTTYMLEKSVSQFVFESVLEKNGKNPKDYPIKNMDPSAAASAMQQGQDNIKAIMVWNPFALSTLQKRKDSYRLFDSSQIPEQVIDMVVVSAASLKKPGGEQFALAVLDCYYQLNKLLADPKEGDQTLVALGAKFSNLSLEEMREVAGGWGNKTTGQTRFYSTPAKALTLFNSPEFRTKTMPHVVSFCESHDIVTPLAKDDKRPRYGFNDPNAYLNFSTEYLDLYSSGK